MVKVIFLLSLVSLILSCKPQSHQDTHKAEISSIFGDDSASHLSDKIRIPVTAFGPVDTSNMPGIYFPEPVFNFDTIVEGALLKHTFHFENSGESELYLLDVRVSCGCTVASYPKEAIAPGEKGEINVTFDSQNKKKEQNRNIIIISNTYPNESSIQLKGFVKEIK